MKPGPAISAERKPAAGRSSFSMMVPATVLRWLLERLGQDQRKIGREIAVVGVARAFELNTCDGFSGQLRGDALELLGNGCAGHYSEAPELDEGLGAGFDSFDSEEDVLLPSFELDLAVESVDPEDPLSASAAFL